MTFSNSLAYIIRSGIGRRLALMIFAFSAIVTVILAAEQLNTEYTDGVSEIHSQLNQIRDSYSDSLARSLWVTSKQDLQLQLEGILRLPNMQYLEIRTPQQAVIATAGHPQNKRILQQTTPLNFEYLGKQVYLGELTSAASLEGLYQRLQHDALFILLRNAIKTFLVSFFILYLFQLLVGRHLRKIAYHVENMGANATDLPIVLDKKTMRGRKVINDELDQLVGAFNKMNSRLKTTHQNLIESEENTRLMIESVPDYAILRIDPQGKVETWNLGAQRIMGYCIDEIVGRHFSIFYTSAGTASVQPEQFLKQVESKGWDKNEGWWVRKDGSRFWAEVSISALCDSNVELLGYSLVIHDITESKLAEEKIERLAFYDTLTQLPNRLLLLDRLKQAMVSSIRDNRKGALLFIDLDNFKNLNDTLGHHIGDLLLQQVAQRLASCIREGDTVGRFGGDEFVIILGALSDQTIEAAGHTKAIGEKLFAALAQPFQLDNNTYRCAGSVGVTLFSGTQQTTDELMQQADIAMYQAKKAGRNTLRFFDQEMQSNISARVLLEGELQKALESRQFQLHYQIQVDSAHRPLGAEVLIRWLHPVRGLVSPALFIPLAEESGHIVAIGTWVLDTACAQLKEWQKNALTRDLTLSVNVSAKQFYQSDFINKVQDYIQRYAINPQLLKLELTEGMLLDNIEFVITTMNKLHDIGVRLSLDDFGTGYSSLQYLKKLPLDQLKIDQSFVRDISTDVSDKAIVTTIITMSQVLNMDVIAEGVETEEQRQLLLNSGCTHFQGYLFGKPIPLTQFEEMLKQR